MRFFFPNPWGVDQGNRAFSLLHGFLGRLYRLITWQGGFNSRPGPVYFDMDRISLWAEFLGWVCTPTPFIRCRSGLVFGAIALWACALGLRSEPVHILFSTLSYNMSNNFEYKNK